MLIWATSRSFEVPCFINAVMRGGICGVSRRKYRILKNQQIQNSTPGDIEEIFRLYRIATDFMRSKKTVVVWPEFERSLVETEIAENRQWKLVEGNVITCVWAITFSDEQIWEEKDNNDAIYIHRIATNPEYRNQNFVSLIVEWAREYAEGMGKRYIRLDTLGRNEKLIAHYTRNGFNFLGMFQLTNTAGLPGHYQHGEAAALFEIDLATE
jgi:GNAT superfamily N-acetyltransferase